MKLTACTTKDSLRALFTMLLVLQQVCFFTEGLVIDPKSLTDSETHNFTYCLGSGEPLQFLNPFNPSVRNQEGFVALNWFLDINNDPEIALLSYYTQLDVRDKRVKVYEFWGIELTDMTTAVSAIYRAELGTKKPKQTIKMKVVIATAPKLASQKLELKRQVESDGAVTLSCGEVSSLGDPPINLQLKTSKGEVLNSSFRRGILSVTIAKENDTGDYVCEVDWDRSVAASCITDKERLAWEGSVLLSSKGSSSGGMTTIIIAVVVVVVIIAVIIIVVVVCMKRKASRVYKAKHEEEKTREGANGGDNAIPLLNELDNKGRSPIYKGGASPYAVGGIKLTDVGDHPAKKAPVAPSEDSTMSSSSTRQSPNGGDEKKKAPRAKPRSVFLTASMEALDQIAKGQDPTIGSQV